MTMLLIPRDPERDIELVFLPQQAPNEDGSAMTLSPKGEDLQRQIYPILTSTSLDTGETSSQDEDVEQGDEESIRFLQIQSTLLWRPTQERPGLVAYHLPLSSSAYHAHGVDKDDSRRLANRRATGLAMTCGLFQCRFYGHVLVNFMEAPGSCTAAATATNNGGSQQQQWLQALQSLAVAGAVDSPDDRLWHIDNNNNDDEDHVRKVRAWILRAPHENYHDQETVQRWARIITNTRRQQQDNDNSSSNSSSDEDEDEDNNNHDADSDSNNHQKANVSDEPKTSTTSNVPMGKEFVTNQPLCLHCRGPTQNLCEQCQGAYFCKPPRDCQTQGWSHDCLCSTWKFYVNRRNVLSCFPFVDKWYAPLVARECQVSHQPYEEDFLVKRLGLVVNDDGSPTWWATERFGWSGGASASARQIDPERRVSYTEGFAPLTMGQFPLESVVSTSKWKRLCDDGQCEKNQAGLYRLETWSDYYKLRNIPDSSPASLLLTFPLTLYYALVEYGTVPWTVAQMMEKPLRIDIVGAEKELNFLDLFQEVAFLLADQVSTDASSPLLELVFVVRKDMLPESLVGRRSDGTYGLDLEISLLLRVRVVEGTYGDSVNPNLDCGSRIGPPSMVMAFNAGLYAYESWRSVLKYLKENPNIVGVMTDYNEWSGLQCASLGGNRETLRLNPFRPPRAMPVFSMNLPQFSNGFLYAINPQELD